MKTTVKVISGAVAFLVTVLFGAAQDFVPGKVYVADISGGVSFAVDGSPNVLKKGDTLLVQGARNETAPAAYVVFVYSNGTSIYIDEKTIVQIAKFEQKPFPKGIDTTVTEPSISHTVGRITQGRIIITTNKLATGTTMIYMTPHAEVKIRGQEVVIEVYDRESRIYVINGDVTVTSTNSAALGVGQIFHSGRGGHSDGYTDRISPGAAPGAGDRPKPARPPLPRSLPPASAPVRLWYSNPFPGPAVRIFKPIPWSRQTFR